MLNLFSRPRFDVFFLVFLALKITTPAGAAESSATIRNYLDTINHSRLHHPQPTPAATSNRTQKAKVSARSALPQRFASVPRPQVNKEILTGFEQEGITQEVGMLVLVLRPVNENDDLVDPKITLKLYQDSILASPTYRKGDLFRHLDNSINWQVTSMIKLGAEASRFRPEQNPHAVSSIKHVLKGWHDFYEPIPLNPNGYKRDYPEQYVNPFIDVDTLLDRVNVCDYVDNKNVRQVWILFLGQLAESGQKTANDFVWPEWHINSRYIDYAKGVPNWTKYLGPHCNYSYTIFPHGIDREDMPAHIWGHSIENILREIDREHLDLWQGDIYAAKEAKDILPILDSLEVKKISVIPGSTSAGETPPNIARCGSVHTTPNGIWDYDKGDPKPLSSILDGVYKPDRLRESITELATSQINIKESDYASVLWPSDCLNWNPDGPGGYGRIQTLDSKIWYPFLVAPDEVNWDKSKHLYDQREHTDFRWQRWLFQHMPGFRNQITHNGKPFRNWWEAYLNFDSIKKNNETLLAPSPSYSYSNSGGRFVDEANGNKFISRLLADPAFTKLKDNNVRNWVGVENNLELSWDLGVIKGINGIRLQIKFIKGSQVKLKDFLADFNITCSDSPRQNLKTIVKTQIGSLSTIREKVFEFPPTFCRYIYLKVLQPNGRIYMSEINFNEVTPKNFPIYPLNVSIRGFGKVVSQPAGISCDKDREMCTHYFNEGTVVELTAIADSNTQISRWSGDCVPIANGKASVTISNGASCNVEFAPPYFTLSVVKLGTTDNITSSPSGIDCADTCSFEYLKGTVVDLNPLKKADIIFSGDCDFNGQVKITSKKTCFVAPKTQDTIYTLNLEVMDEFGGPRGGRVSGMGIQCEPGSTSCTSIKLPTGFPVTLTAIPDDDYRLFEWSGCKTSQSQTISFNLVRQNWCLATFCKVSGPAAQEFGYDCCNGAERSASGELICK